jgi:hypothetical protein
LWAEAAQVTRVARVTLVLELVWAAEAAEVVARELLPSSVTGGMVVREVLAAALRVEMIKLLRAVLEQLIT